MTFEIITMNGYGLYVWSSFIFTLISFFCSISCNKNSIKKRTGKI